MTTKAKAKEDQKVSTHVLDVNSAQLHRILSDAVLHASKDATLPMLNIVHVETDAERILAVATDRFTQGVSWIDLDGTVKGGTAHDDSGCSFNLSLNDVATLIKISKTTRALASERLVSIIQNYDGTVEFKFWSGESITVKHVDVDFPRAWRRLFSGKGTEVARTALGVSQEYMARFSKVACTTPDQRIALFSFDSGHTQDGENRQRKPFGVRVGDNFVGLIMPSRLEQTAEWVPPAFLGTVPA